MKANNNSNNSIIRNFFERIGYALQVIIIAISIPLLSYLEVTHDEKVQNSSVKTSNLQLEKVNAPMLTLK
jgi:hypothetical protein